MRVKVCVFGNGGPVSPPAEYGLQVWNPDTGQLVYNSGRDAILKPQLISMTGATELNGNTLIRHSVSSPGISRPMYAPTNTGAGAGGFSFTDDGKLMSVFYTWVSSNGYSLYSNYGGQTLVYDRINEEGYFAYDRAIYQPGRNKVMVIDAEDYFVF